MHAHLVVPHLFWPQPDAGFPDPMAIELPALSLLTGRGALQRGRCGTDLTGWLAAAFGLPEDALPAAAASLLADGTEPDSRYWLRADPVHLAMERDRVRLVDGAAFRLDAAEAQALADHFNRHFAADGLTLIVRHPHRWYLALEQPPRLKTHALERVAGRDINPFFPRDEDGGWWRQRLNETQMLFFDHPVNAAREARGDVPVNSVWFWGGGVLPAVAPAEFEQVWTDHPVLSGLALAAGQPLRALPPDATAWLATATASGRHLLLLDGLMDAGHYQDVDGWQAATRRLETDWFAPLLAALRNGRLTSLGIDLPGSDGGLSLTVRHTDLRKFWRRPAKLPRLRG